MEQHKTKSDDARGRAQDLFDELSDGDALISKIAHARRPNASTEYDGAHYIETFKKVLDPQLESYTKALEYFKNPEK